MKGPFFLLDILYFKMHFLFYGCCYNPLSWSFLNSPDKCPLIVMGGTALNMYCNLKIFEHQGSRADHVSIRLHFKGKNTKHYLLTFSVKYSNRLINAATSSLTNACSKHFS
jgi:hypothetical protein